VEGSSFCESESNECVSSMVANFPCIWLCANVIDGLDLDPTLGANSFEIRLGAKSAARKNLDCEENTNEVRQDFSIDVKASEVAGRRHVTAMMYLGWLECTRHDPVWL
jgi:hypothetical protein